MHSTCRSRASRTVSNFVLQTLITHLLLSPGDVHGFYNYQPKDLRCYTCNIDGYPSCDDPFSMDHSQLANCNTLRPDNATEMCAKMIGTVVDIGLGEVSKSVLGSQFLGRGCFPLGEGWIWRVEPYNETFMFGNLTVEGSIYICRNSRCNLSTINEPLMLISVTLITISIVMQLVRF